MRYHIGLGVGHTYGFHSMHQEPEEHTEDLGRGGNDPEERNIEDLDAGERDDDEKPKERNMEDLVQEAIDDELGSTESGSQSGSDYSFEVDEQELEDEDDSTDGDELLAMDEMYGSD